MRRVYFWGAVVAVVLVGCESIPKEESKEILDLRTPDHIAKVENVEKLLLYGQGYYDLGDYENALHSYNQVLMIDPDNQVAELGKERAERAMGLVNQGSFLDYQRY